jgi:putative transposase
MRRTEFNEKQIAAILRESEAGAQTSELCRRHGISRASFYLWKYGSPKASEAGRMGQLENENRQLKHAMAEQTAHIATLKAALAKKP